MTTDKQPVDPDAWRPAMEQRPAAMRKIEALVDRLMAADGNTEAFQARRALLAEIEAALNAGGKR